MQCDSCGEQEAILECPECQDESGKAKAMCEECSQTAHKANWRAKKHRVYYLAIKEQQELMKDWPAEWKKKRQKFEQKLKEVDAANEEIRCRQGILEQQVKDDVIRLQQKVKQKGIEVLQKLKADTSDKMAWFKDFKQKNKECFDQIHKLEKDINDLMHTNDVEGFPDRFAALEEQTQTVTCDEPEMEGECPKLSTLTELKSSDFEAEIEKLYSDVEVITAPMSPSEESSPVDQVDNEVFVSLQSNINGEGMFWLQPELSKDTFAHLLSISYGIRTVRMQSSSDWKSYGEMKETPKIGDVCYARNPSDKKWYRSSVLETNQRMPNETSVRFLDFGNPQHIKNDDILPVRDDLELPNIPYQALECMLYEKEKNFKMDTRWAMVDLVKTARLKCKFLGKIESDGRSINHVDLNVIKPDGSEMNVRKFMDKKMEDAGKGSGKQAFASRDIRLLEDPHMFDKPAKKRSKKPDVMKDGEVDIHKLAKLPLPSESKRSRDAPAAKADAKPSCSTDTGAETGQSDREDNSRGRKVEDDTDAGQTEPSESVEQEKHISEEVESQSAPETVVAVGESNTENEENEPEDEFFDAEDKKQDSSQVTKSVPSESGKVDQNGEAEQSEPKCDPQNDTDKDSGSADKRRVVDSISTDAESCVKNGHDSAATRVEQSSDNTAVPSESIQGDDNQTEQGDNLKDTTDEVTEEKSPEELEEDRRQRAKYHDDSKVYGLPNYPKSAGHFMKVIIDHPLTKDGTFWARFACSDSDQQEELNKFNEDLGASVQYTDTCRELELGALVLVSFKKKWGRSRVIENEDQAKCKVRCLDYGGSARVNKSLVKYLPSSFFSSTYQAVHCSMSQGDNTNFSKDASKKFADLTRGGKELTAQVCEKKDDLIYVNLVDYSDIDVPVDVNQLVYDEERRKREKRTTRSSPRQDARYGSGGSDHEHPSQGRGPPKILQPVMPIGSNPQLYPRQGQQGHPGNTGRGPMIPDGAMVNAQQYPGQSQCESFGFKPTSAQPMYITPTMGQGQQNDVNDWQSEGETNTGDDTGPSWQENGAKGYTGGDVRRCEDVNQHQPDDYSGQQQSGDVRNEGPGDTRNGYSGRRDAGHRRRDSRDSFYGGGNRRNDGYNDRRDGGQHDGYGRDQDGRRNEGYRQGNRQGGGGRDKRRTSYGTGNAPRRGRRSFDQGGGGARGCFSCGDQGHMKRDCPNLQ